MAPILGRRKRRNELNTDASMVDTSSPEHNQNHLHGLFRKHFEATFEPIEEAVVWSTNSDAGARVTNESESDWQGLSDNEILHDIEVTIIEHGKPKMEAKNCNREEYPTDSLKDYMTTKPPSSLDQRVSTARKRKCDISDSGDTTTDAANLKKDLALQRLLNESHLLELGSSLSGLGSKRHKALDMRFQDLGSKASIVTQRNMPLAHRKGIASKTLEREETRRKNAKENGIILEKTVKTRKGFEARRERGLGAPGVGKFRGGMLKLSRKDVADIVGPKKTSNGKKPTT